MLFRSDDWNIDVGSFLDSLSISARIGNDDDAGLLERASDVVGKVTGGEATGDGGGSGVRGELEDCALAVWTGGDDGDVGWVVDCDEHAGCEDDLLPVAEC